MSTNPEVIMVSSPSGGDDVESITSSPARVNPDTTVVDIDRQSPIGLDFSMLTPPPDSKKFAKDGDDTTMYSPISPMISLPAGSGMTTSWQTVRGEAVLHPQGFTANPQGSASTTVGFGHASPVPADTHTPTNLTEPMPGVADPPPLPHPIPLVTVTQHQVALSLVHVEVDRQRVR